MGTVEIAQEEYQSNREDERTPAQNQSPDAQMFQTIEVNDFANDTYPPSPVIEQHSPQYIINNRISYHPGSSERNNAQSQSVDLVQRSQVMSINAGSVSDDVNAVRAAENEMRSRVENTRNGSQREQTSISAAQTNINQFIDEGDVNNEPNQQQFDEGEAGFGRDQQEVIAENDDAYQDNM